MAVQTALPHEPRQTRARGVEELAAVERARMLGFGMALLAQPGSAHRQQPWLRRAVRRMTIGAAVRDRRMLVQEGSTLLGMALEAGLVDRFLLQQFAVERAVRVVAVGADHQPFLDGMV